MCFFAHRLLVNLSHYSVFLSAVKIDHSFIAVQESTCDVKLGI